MSANEKGSSPSMLEYHGSAPAARTKRWGLRRIVLSIAGIMIVIGIGCAVADTTVGGISLFGMIGVPLTIGGMVCLFLGTFGMALWEVLFRRRETDEEHEVQWARQQERKKELLAIAEQVYANGPIGKWRWSDITPSIVLGAAAEIHAHRWIMFDTQGSGRYGWEYLDQPRSQGETAFEYKPQATDTLLVRLTSLPDAQWHTVEYGIDVKRQPDGDYELALWFDRVNPRPVDFSEHWPFRGEFLRSSV